MALKRRDFLKAAVAGTACAGAAASPAVGAVAREPKEMPPEAVGMLYDSTLCIGCKACQHACKEANGMPPEPPDDQARYWPEGTMPLWDAPVDTSGRTLNVIKVYRNGDASVKDRETDGFAFMKRHCLHCVDPSCVSVCPVSAMTKDPLTGIVAHHADRCIGCRYCVYGCPFNAPRYEYDDPLGQIQKCQFCSHLQARGLTPACCDVCPTGASLFGKVSDLKAEAQRRLAAEPGSRYLFPRGRLGGRDQSYEGTIAAGYQPHVYGVDELGGTQVMYLSAVPFDKMGLPTDVPALGYPAISEGIQHTLYKGMIAPAVLLGGLMFLAWRSGRRLHDDDDDTRS